MKEIGYYCGKTAPIEELSIPMTDRAVYFGDGVYEFCICRNGVAFRMDDHINRFWNSMTAIRIQPDFSKEKLKALLCGLLAKVDNEISALYWQISRGAAPRAHAFPKDAHPCLYVTVTPSRLSDLQKPIRCMTKPDIRFLMCNIKTIDLLPAILASQEAEEAGCTECILHRDGRVTECAHSNVSILRDGRLITAPTDNLILPGIARDRLLAACRRHQIPVEERPYFLEELMAADEIIVTSTSKFALRCTEIDGKPVGGRDQARIELLQNAVYQEFLEETNA